MMSSTNSSPRRVLLIDDNVDAVSMMQALLLMLGFDVAVAYNGREGLELATTFHPQVVFLDLGMPVMNGYEVAVALRKLPGLEDVFLLALTGWNDQHTRAAVIAAGFDRHLVKPPDFEQIITILNGFFTPDPVVL